MLVLSRRTGEAVHLFRDGEYVGAITMIEIKHKDKAGIGFEFPPEYRVVRTEILDDAQKQAMAASDSRAPKTAKE